MGALHPGCGCRDKLADTFPHVAPGWKQWGYRLGWASGCVILWLCLVLSWIWCHEGVPEPASPIARARLFWLGTGSGFAMGDGPGARL